jgi:hypothetical protein
MKKVAATSGQSVNFALVFVVEMLRAGIWAGRDTVLNFFLSSSSSDSRSPMARSKLTFRRIQSLCAHARKKWPGGKNFFANRTEVLGEREHRAFEKWLATVPRRERRFLFGGAIGHFYTRVHHKR